MGRRSGTRQRQELPCNHCHRRCASGIHTAFPRSPNAGILHRTGVLLAAPDMPGWIDETSDTYGTPDIEYRGFKVGRRSVS
jgi:hypothetical protein